MCNLSFEHDKFLCIIYFNEDKFHEQTQGASPEEIEFFSGNTGISFNFLGLQLIKIKEKKVLS